MTLTGALDADAAERRRWTVSAAIVGAVHLVPLLFAAFWLRAQPPAERAPPPAVIVDMAPLPPAPPKPVVQTPPAPQPQRIDPPTPQQTVSKSPPTPEAAVSLPEAPPRPPEPAPRVTPPPVAQPPTAPAAAPSNAAPTWQGQVLGRLERFKIYPGQAQFRGQQGVASVRFVLDREGRVLSVKLDKSSGVASLDEEAVALVRRAQPFPKPPQAVAGDRVELAAPVEFSLKGRR